MYVNKVIIIGNLTRDPELRALPSGMSVTQFSLATNRVYKDKAGAKKESTDYHNIVVFGRQAETSAQWLKKGQAVYVEGRLQTRSWDDKDGKKQYRTEIVAERVQFGQKAGGGGAGAPAGSSAPSQNAPSENSAPDEIPGGKDIEYPEEEINPEDIPF
jgi:single-strand DNA-binding protein